ncbi:MAG: methyltransferase domain-containing protein [Acidobacteriota bacterium]|nr:methyltransferase domain-containing protein [Acidobacteriota bacterium]
MSADHSFPEQVTERTFPAGKLRKLEGPDREQMLPVAPLVAALGVASGDCVADIGAGTGYLSLPLAAAAGPKGVVHAVDMQQPMLDYLGDKLQKQAVTNVQLHLGSSSQTGLDTASVQLAFYCNVWHEIHEPLLALHEARRILAPGGRIAICDWRVDATPNAGPPIDIRIPEAGLTAMLEKDGWHSILCSHAGQFNFLAIATRG